MLVDKQSNTTARPLRINKTVLRFDKSRVPLAPGFWEDQFGQLRWNRKGWAATRCIFHASKSGKSFSVHRDGGFFCHGCGVSGGGLIDFVMLRDSCDFKSAATKLGAWEEAGQPSPPPVMVPVSYLTCDFSIGGNRYSVSVKDSARSYVGEVWAFYRQASEELTALGMEQSESAEGESRWARLSLGHHELREMGIL